MPRALITGVTGQDGSYLAEMLLEKGYEVHGVVRRTGPLDQSRLKHLCNNPDIYGRRLFLHYAALEDPTTLRRVLVKTEPDELYHLAGQSHVGLSFDMVESTCEMTALGSLRLLEMIRDLEHQPRLFHASSSEIFGHSESSPQDERTPYRPVTPYGCAKAFATQMVEVYRQTFNLYACNGILYNHESPRRGENFVTQKICMAAAAIKLGRQRDLCLGNLAGKRDWGDARDYVRGMWLSLQHEQPLDYVFATGELHSVQEVVEIAFKEAGLDWRQHVKQDPRFMRPDEPTQSVGNSERAQRLLNWRPTRSFDELIREMTREDLRLLAGGARVTGA
jgi:GDPmannose 4,6-dehydratase